MPPKLHDRLRNDFHGNAWPAMVEHLASQLNVSSDSLRRLGIGYVPIVKFTPKNKPEYISYGGWWCNPERDAEGGVIGLSLRSNDGKKIMYPGSKHGLIYELSTTFISGLPVYQHGSNNWTRTMDAGVDCPICGKPDGCLLSAENELDPKAVICIRTPAGAEKPMKFGWLHIRKDEGNVNTGSPLPPSESPIIVVEGMSDCATTLDIGFVGIGRPSATACLGELADLLRSRSVIIIGENDSGAGVLGMNSTFETLKKVCSKVVKVLPPADVKDLRDWRKKYNITKESLLAYVEEYGNKESSSNLLDNSTPLYVAQTWLKQEQTLKDTLILRKHKGQWLRYQENRYEEIDPDSIVRGGLYRFLEGKEYVETKPDGSIETMSYKTTRSRVSDIVDAMNMECPINADPPCWLDEVEGPNASTLLSFRNGILDTSAYLEGNDSLLENTPTFFTLTAMPYDYDPTSTCPMWLEWLDQTLGDDPLKIALLQEWFGYSMTPDMSMQKLMFLQGLPGSGKGTTLEVYQALLGSNQVASTSFRSIANEYGRAPLVGKLAAIMADARLPRNSDSVSALETLLNIVGQDGVNINRKYLPELPHHHLMTRFTIAVNELPELPDTSQALQRRLLMLHYAKSFVGMEDIDLRVKLCSEITGIATWALEGLKRLRQNGVFSLPESSKTLISEFKKITSPLTEFVEECCEIDETRRKALDKVELFDAWSKWCQERGFSPGFRTRFTQRLTASYPLVTTDASTILGKKTSTYVGIDLQGWAKQTFLGKPSGE